MKMSFNFHYYYWKIIALHLICFGSNKATCLWISSFQFLHLFILLYLFLNSALMDTHTHTCRSTHSRWRPRSLSLFSVLLFNDVTTLANCQLIITLQCDNLPTPTKQHAREVSHYLSIKKSSAMGEYWLKNVLWFGPSMIAIAKNWWPCQLSKLN